MTVPVTVNAEEFNRKIQEATDKLEQAVTLFRAAQEILAQLPGIKITAGA